MRPSSSAPIEQEKKQDDSNQNRRRQALASRVLFCSPPPIHARLRFVFVVFTTNLPGRRWAAWQRQLMRA
jgi:hypothetical protein